MARLIIYRAWTSTLLYLSVLFLGSESVFNHPSNRALYYLHTKPANWSSARNTCASYGGHLIHNKDTGKISEDLFVLDQYLTWKGSLSGLTTDIWSGLHLDTTSDRLYWDACYEYDKEAVSCDVRETADQLKHAVYGGCVAMDWGDLSPILEECDHSLPYICQINEGECWFLAIDDTAIKDDSPRTVNRVTVEQCARTCREEEKGADGSECWGFTYEKALSRCHLHSRVTRHAPLQDVTSSLKQSHTTAYMKICIGGSVTDMAPVLSGSVTPTTSGGCSGDGTTEDSWRHDLCFCECELPPSFQDPSELSLTLDQKIETIVDHLHVNPANTSAAYRNLNSAEDNRTSSTSIGSMGVAFMTLILGVILLTDVRVLLHHLIACWSQTPKGLMSPRPKAK